MVPLWSVMEQQGISGEGCNVALLLMGNTRLRGRYNAGGSSNEPVGFTTIYNNPMSTLPPFGSYDSFGFRRFDNIGTRLSIRTDGDGGESNPNYLRMLFPQGMTGGAYDSPFNAGIGFNCSKLYSRLRMRVSSNWTDNGNAETKFCFFDQYRAFEGDPNGNNHYVTLSEVGAFKPGLKLQSLFTDNPPAPSGPNFYASSSITKGDWHTVEWVIECNTPGLYNGVFRLWVDGNLLRNQSDIGYKNIGEPPTFSEYWCNPTYGGGTASPPADQWIDIDNWYTSGAN